MASQDGDFHSPAPSDSPQNGSTNPMTDLSASHVHSIRYDHSLCVGSPFAYIQVIQIRPCAARFALERSLAVPIFAFPSLPSTNDEG